MRQSTDPMNAQKLEKWGAIIRKLAVMVPDERCLVLFWKKFAYQKISKNKTTFHQGPVLPPSVEGSPLMKLRTKKHAVHLFPPRRPNEIVRSCSFLLSWPLCRSLVYCRPTYHLCATLLNEVLHSSELSPVKDIRSFSSLCFFLSYGI